MTDTGSSADSWDVLVPVPDLSAGPPDPLAIATWHMALSNLVGAEIPHQLLGLWLFPEQGGSVLLGPEALAQDRLEVPDPAPYLSQDQLFELEEVLRRAHYASAVAVPVRNEARDLGLILIGTFEPGAYGPGAARSLRRLAERLTGSLAALGGVLTATAAPTDPVATTDELVAALPGIVGDAPSGPELVRRLSGLLHPHLPHDRLEILAFANGTRAAIPLSGLSSRRRWGAPGGTWADFARLMTELLGDGATVIVGNLAAEAPGLSWPGGGPARIGSVLAARLTLGGEVVGILVVGHAAQDLYREADEVVAATVARSVGARVMALRLESEVQALRGQLEVLQAPSLPVLRAAEALAATAHLGEALHRFATEVREVIPHAGIRFLLRSGEDQLIELAADSIRPLADLPSMPIADHPMRGILAAERPWNLAHEGGHQELGVGLKVADRVIGAMVISAASFDGPREAAAALQQFAAIAAPHLELLRRGARMSSGAPRVSPIS